MGMQRWKRRAYFCMSWWRERWWSCIRRFVAANSRGGRAVWPGYFVLGGLFDLFRNLDTSLIVFLRGLCSGLGPSEGGIVYGLFSKEALYVGKASVNRTHCPGLAARLTEHPMSLSPRSPRCKQTPVSTSQAQVMGCLFLSIDCLPHDLSNLSGRSIGNINGGSDGQCEGCGRGTPAAPQRGQCQSPGSSSTAFELETTTEATVGKYLGLFCCPRSSFKSVPEQASPVSRCTRTGHSFFLSVHGADTRRTCVLRASRTYVSV